MDSLRNSTAVLSIAHPKRRVRCEELQHHQLPEDSLQQELQHFWKQEILHLQHEPSSSLEKQFLYEDYLTRPIPIEETTRRQKKVCRPHKCEQSRVVRGEDLNDIPTTYLISGLQPHEIPVIGTYVDSSVLPGFKYKVRLNQTKKYHFGGRALTLLSVGAGYGKRLTFESKSSLRNKNYFWSDNHSEGYGFALEVVSEGDKFVVKDANDGLLKGMIEVLRFGKPQRELQTTIMEDGSVLKKVQVDIWCRYVDESTEFRLEGVASVVKAIGSSEVAEVKVISLQKNALHGFQLLPTRF